MKSDVATAEAKANPQAYACMGVTFLGGFLGIFFAVFLTDTLLRVLAGILGLLVFAAGIAGHTHFKRSEQRSDFRASRTARRTIGVIFGLLAALSVCFAVFSALSGDFGYAIPPAVFAVGIFPFVRAMFGSDEKNG